jgi:hypothetical protein
MLVPWVSVTTVVIVTKGGWSDPVAQSSEVVVVSQADHLWGSGIVREYFVAYGRRWLPGYAVVRQNLKNGYNMVRDEVSGDTGNERRLGLQPHRSFVFAQVTVTEGKDSITYYGERLGNAAIETEAGDDFSGPVRSPSRLFVLLGAVGAGLFLYALCALLRIGLLALRLMGRSEDDDGLAAALACTWVGRSAATAMVLCLIEWVFCCGSSGYPLHLSWISPLFFVGLVVLAFFATRPGRRAA